MHHYFPGSKVAREDKQPTAAVLDLICSKDTEKPMFFTVSQMGKYFLIGQVIYFEIKVKQTIRFHSVVQLLLLLLVPYLLAISGLC